MVSWSMLVGYISEGCWLYYKDLTKLKTYFTGIRLEKVSKLVFYAESTITVISGRRLQQFQRQHYPVLPLEGVFSYLQVQAFHNILTITS